MVEPPDGGAESPVETGRRPLSGKLRMHDGRDGLSGEEKVHFRFRRQSRIAAPGSFELGLIDRTAELRHESLRKGNLLGSIQRLNAILQYSFSTITDFQELELLYLHWNPKGFRSRTALAASSYRDDAVCTDYYTHSGRGGITTPAACSCK